MANYKKIEIDKLFLYLFLTSIFLFKIPSFYILPLIQNSLFATQSLARIFLALTFLYKLFENFDQKKEWIDKTKKTVLLIMFFFVLQSLSIISATNLNSFLSRFKDIIVGIMSFFVFCSYRQYSKQIITTILFSVAINILFGLIILFVPTFFSTFLTPLIYQKYLAMLSANIDRGRLYIPTFDEIAIPLFFVINTKKTWSKIIKYLLFSTVSFISFASNFRTNFLMLVFGLLTSFSIFKKIGKTKIIVIALVIMAVAFLVNTITLSISGYSFYDRFVSSDDVSMTKGSSAAARVFQIKTSFEMGASSLTGVGLGNYYDNLYSRNKIYSSDSSTALLSESAQEYVHNIFGSILAESGYLSLLVFIFLLILFIKNDIKILKNKDFNRKAFVLSFWILFIFGFFNPTVSGTFQFLFWGLRGLLL